jgi:predicted kinase
MYNLVAFGNFRLILVRESSILFFFAAIITATFCFPSNHNTITSTKFSIDARNINRHEVRRLSSWMETLPSPLTWSLFGFRPHPHYNCDISTEDNYRSDNHESCGRYKTIRQRLDYTYHAHYSCSRQLLQDTIIESMLTSTKVEDKDTGEECSIPAEPWIVFTAGVMGAGKTHTIRQLHANGQFPLESFVTVDPDEIRRLLPEFHVYVETCPERAGELTRKEAGMIAEILTEAALERGQNVLVDGSLRDNAWYQNYFTTLRHAFPTLKLGIIHVTAPVDAILGRVEVRSAGRRPRSLRRLDDPAANTLFWYVTQQRAKTTGRVVPRDVLLKSIEQVPRSVKILNQYVDVFLEIYNAGYGKPIAFESRGTMADSVNEMFKQKCAA